METRDTRRDTRCSPAIGSPELAEPYSSSRVLTVWPDGTLVCTRVRGAPLPLAVGDCIWTDAPGSLTRGAGGVSDRGDDDEDESG